MRALDKDGDGGGPPRPVGALARLSASLRSHWPVLLIAAIFALLAAAGNLALPPFEGPDEPMHYAYVQHLAQGYGFPSQDVPEPFHDSYRPQQEASQPPLYYGLAALVTRWIPGSGDVTAALQPNPYFTLDDPHHWLDNENLWLRSPHVGTLNPGFVAGVRSARLVSTCFGILAVIATYGAALACFDRDRGLACIAAAWVGFNPQLIHISGVVSNDSAAAGLAALSLWIMARWIVRGPSLRRALAWGAALGLAALTKVHVLGILPICALGFWLGARSRRHRRILRWAAALLGMTLLLGGWWYARGLLLTGDPLGLVPHLEHSAWVGEPFSLAEQLARLAHVDWSYWAAFGNAAVEPPAWLWAVVVWWGRIGLLGVGVHLWRTRASLGRRRWLIALLALWLSVYLAALLWWLWAYPLALGRLMFPAAGAIGILLVVGWRAWLPRRWRPVALWAMTGGLLAFAVACLVAVIRPAYVRPPQLSESQVAALGQGSHVVFADRARLLAGQVGPQPVRPGAWTWVELCWESVAPLDQDYVEFVQLLGPANQIVGRRHTHTGLGSFPTSAWQPGDAFCDQVRVRVDESAPAPAVYAVEAGLYDREEGRRLEARREAGGVVAPVVVGRLEVQPAQPLVATPPHPAEYRLGDEIRLLGYDVQPDELQAGEALTLTLYWRAERRPTEDYLVFVHLIGPGGGRVAQADGPPRGGLYPTSWWDAGERIVDTRQIELPAELEPGEHQLLVGLYRWPSLERLPAHTAGGEPVPDAAIMLTRVPVSP